MENLPILDSAWQAAHPAGHTVRPHRHRNWELVYYLSGAGDTTLDGTAVPFSAHTFALIPPGVLHDEHHTAAGTVLCLGFSADFALSAGVFADSDYTVRTLARRLYWELHDQPSAFRAMTSFKLAELQIELERMRAPSPHGKRDLEYAIHFMEENYSRSLSLQSLAADCGYSYHYFYHRFRERTGAAPQQYLLSLRLAHAAERLRTTDDSCTEIALACGFYGSAQFSALFRRAYGVPPLTFRTSPGSG